jgi:prepilin-type N-terminal cleavage/methylation domain-containing protein
VRRRGGFTLIELLIGIVVMAVLATALTRILLSDSRFVSKQEALMTARQTARAAMNVLTDELRMISDSGLLAAGADSVVFRMPYAFGVACDALAGERIVALLPADSLMYATAVADGIARNVNDTVYTFHPGITVASSAAVGTCTAAGYQLVPGGTVVGVTPDTVATLGQIVYLYQTVGYRFGASVDMPGRTGLWRRVSGNAYEELAAPFDSTTRFRFLVGPGLLVNDAPPADLTTVAGLEITLIAESYEIPRGASDYQDFELPLQVAFLNKAN